VTVIAVDDTDSRTDGMCTTYLAAHIAADLVEHGGRVDRLLLVRLNPAVRHKTRGNAALAIHTDVSAGDAVDIAAARLTELAIDSDDRTSPGLVVAPGDPTTVGDAVVDFARRALREKLNRAEALALADDAGYRHRGWKADGCAVRGRGRIGALAAVGAWNAFDEWTAERIAYREFDQCGTAREVDEKAVFRAAEAAYPTVWDTVDRATGETVCVPNAPGPILYGIRGDEAAAVERVADEIAAGDTTEHVDRWATFVTNQGTDQHLAGGRIGSLREGRGYRTDGVVSGGPETRRGGHVFFRLREPQTDAAVDCVAFEPTKRFRDRVRSLRVGDELTACGEHSGGTIKLEKFAVRSLVRTERVTPTCPDCARRMKSAGRNQGYRCRDCSTAASDKVRHPIDRALEIGWYEVPPSARRHIAKPLVRGGFDAPTHPER